MLIRVFSFVENQLSELYHALNADYEIDVGSIRELKTVEQYPAFIFNNDLPDFSQRQREVLKLGFEMGYYERPRATTTNEISDQLDIARRTLEGHLRRAEEKAIESIINITDM